MHDVHGSDGGFAELEPNPATSAPPGGWTPPAATPDAPPAGSQPWAVPYGVHAKPPTYLVWAILSTVLCCMPLGVAAIVHAAQVDSKWAAGDATGAAKSSTLARNLVVASVAATAVLTFAYFAFVAVTLSSGAV